MSRNLLYIDEARVGNQVVFRDRNERVQRNIQEFNETASEIGEEPIALGAKEYLYFFCECSDEKCIERIKVTFLNYRKFHKRRDVFMVKPNHGVRRADEVVHETGNYSVIRKYVYPLQIATELKSSGLNHVAAFNYPNS